MTWEGLLWSLWILTQVIVLLSQKPYNLPLKHADWVQKELTTLEKAGVITRSVSPWASLLL